MPETSSFGMQLILLGMILVGVITAKTGMVDNNSRSSLSDLILNVFLPCNILSSFFDASRSELPSLGIILAISTFTLLFCYVLSKFVLYRKEGVEQKKVLLYATIVSNASFIGNPVIESIFGNEALIYSAIYLIPLRVALWTVGIAIFSGAKGSIRMIVFHPCLVATYIGLFIMVSGFSTPGLVSVLTFGLGNCTTPISMIVVGNILGSVEPKKILGKLPFYYTFIRLVLVPFSLLGILLVLRPLTVITGVSVILCGTPAPVTTTILADKYGSDSELASKIVFSSTLLSIVTLPVLIWLLRFA